MSAVGDLVQTCLCHLEQHGSRQQPLLLHFCLPRNCDRVRETDSDIPHDWNSVWQGNIGSLLLAFIPDPDTLARADMDNLLKSEVAARSQQLNN